MQHVALNLTPLEILNIPESEMSNIPSPLANKIEFFFFPQNEIKNCVETKFGKKRGRPSREECLLRNANANVKKIKTEDNSKLVCKNRKSLMQLCIEKEVDIHNIEIVNISYNPVKVLNGKQGLRLYNAIDLIEPLILYRNNASRYIKVLDKKYDRVSYTHSPWVTIEGVKKLITFAFRKSSRYDEIKLDYLKSLKAYFSHI